MQMKVISICGETQTSDRSARCQAGMWGVERSVFIDRSDAEIISSDSAYFQSFSEGLAVAEIQAREGVRCGYIDTTGRVIWQGK